MQADLLIVGAGISGLRCGIEVLKQKQKNYKKVVILEKYGYFGGRVVSFSTDFDDKEYHWENGAGRIADSHSKVHSLLKHYKLETIPLSPELDWIPNAGDAIQKNPFQETLDFLLPTLLELEPDVLAKHTIKELSTELLGSQTSELLDAFPYRAEVETLRADLAVKSFKNEMASSEGYSVVKTGLSSLIHGMVSEFKKLGGHIFANQDVQDLQKDGSKTLVVAKTPSGDVLWIAPKVILALHADALRTLPPFANAEFLKHLKMEPLLRCYAIFKEPCLKGLNKIVTREPLRYFIPMSDTVAMISYTESQDARKLMNMSTGVLRHFLTNQLRDLLPDREIPDPIYFKTHPWTSGCTYWLPGSYDPVLLAKKSHHPLPAFPGVYCCGESLSLRQAWMEGALESADFLLESFFV